MCAKIIIFPGIMEESPLNRVKVIWAEISKKQYHLVHKFMVLIRLVV